MIQFSVCAMRTGYLLLASLGANQLVSSEKKKVCVILETVLLQGLLPKGNMDKTTPMLAPSAYTDLSNIFPANFASSDNPTCL